MVICFPTVHISVGRFHIDGKLAFHPIAEIFMQIFWNQHEENMHIVSSKLTCCGFFKNSA
jgi:hypothetical protein